MGEHFFDGLTTAVRTATVSRKRALQLIGGALAVAVPTWVPRGAEAGDSPLAVASVALVDVLPTAGSTFTWVFKGAVVHKESGEQFSLQTPSGGISATATGDKARKKFLSLVRFRAVETLRSQLGVEVPEDRIAVVLL